MSHIGRSFDGHPLEDACPCPQEPCGLIDVSRIDPACGQHALAAGKTTRQSYTAERCAMTAPTSPKPHTPADPTVALPPELVATATRAALVARGYDPDVSVRDLPPEDRDLLDVARAVVDAVAADLWAAPTTDLRTALTKLADDLDSYMCAPAVRAVGDELRALLAAHPAPETVSDTRREDVAREIAETHWTTHHEGFQCVGCGWRAVGPREDYGHAARRHIAEVALAVLPAPPVVDEAEVRERIAQDIEAEASRARHQTWMGGPDRSMAVGDGLDEAARIARGVTR